MHNYNAKVIHEPPRIFQRDKEYLYDQIKKSSLPQSVRIGGGFVFSQAKSKYGTLMSEDANWLLALQNLKENNQIIDTGKFIIKEGGLNLVTTFFNTTQSEGIDMTTISKEIVNTNIWRMAHDRSARTVEEYYKNTKPNLEDIERVISNIYDSKNSQKKPSKFMFDLNYYIDSSKDEPQLSSGRVKTQFIDAIINALKHSSVLLKLNDHQYISKVSKSNMYLFLYGLIKEFNNHRPNNSVKEQMLQLPSQESLLTSNNSNVPNQNNSLAMSYTSISVIDEQAKEFLYSHSLNASDESLLNMIIALSEFLLILDQKQEKDIFRADIIKDLMYKLQNPKSYDDLIQILSKEEIDNFKEKHWQDIVKHNKLIQEIHYTKSGVWYVLSLCNWSRLRQIIRLVSIQRYIPSSSKGYFLLCLIEKYNDKLAQTFSGELLQHDCYYCQRVILRKYYPLYRRVLIWLLLQPQSPKLLLYAKSKMLQNHNKWKSYWTSSEEKNDPLTDKDLTNIDQVKEEKQASKNILEIMDNYYLRERTIPFISDIVSKLQMKEKHFLQNLINQKALVLLNVWDSTLKKSPKNSNRVLFYGLGQNLETRTPEILTTVQYLINNKDVTDTNYLKAKVVFRHLRSNKAIPDNVPEKNTGEISLQQLLDKISKKND